MTETRIKAELHDGEVVITVPTGVRYFWIELLAETATSDRALQPAGHFMAPFGFRLDADLLRKASFYKEPFVLKLSSSITLEQEAQSV